MLEKKPRTKPIVIYPYVYVGRQVGRYVVVVPVVVITVRRSAINVFAGDAR